VLDTDPHAGAIAWPRPSVTSITEPIDLGPFEDATSARVLFLRRHAVIGGVSGSPVRHEPEQPTAPERPQPRRRLVHPDPPLGHADRKARGKGRSGQQSHREAGHYVRSPEVRVLHLPS
jgi:hypothetical protein